ncbi:MAG: hypothetical protein AAFV98_04505 [Chloroflexota bacterium]
MITKTRTKIAIAVIMMPILIGGALVALGALSEFLSRFQEGADPSSIFRGHELVIPAEDEAVWLTTAPLSGVSPSRAQQEELIAAYWLAWEALSRAHETGQTDDLSTYWASPVLETIREGITEGQHYITREHELSLLFFSDDRSVAQLEDTFSVTINDIDMTAHATVTLTLDTGRWRIRFLDIEYMINN